LVWNESYLHPSNALGFHLSNATSAYIYTQLGRLLVTLAVPQSARFSHSLRPLALQLGVLEGLPSLLKCLPYITFHSWLLFMLTSNNYTA